LWAVVYWAVVVAAESIGVSQLLGARTGAAPQVCVYGRGLQLAAREPNLAREAQIICPRNSAKCWRNLLHFRL